MRRRSAAALEGLAGASLVIYPPAAAVALLLLGVGRRLAPTASGWAWLWAGYLVPILAVSLASAPDPLMPTLQALFGLLIGAVVVIERRGVVLLGIVIGLLASVAAGLVERELSRRLWFDAGTPVGLAQLWSGVSSVSGDSPGWTRNGVRLLAKSWTLVGEPSGLALSMEVRGASQGLGWQWYTNDPATRQEQLRDLSGAFTRVTGLTASIVRRVRTPTPLAGRTYRVTVELRSSQAVTLSDCPALGLRTFEPAASHCQPVVLDTSWRTHSAIFTFPEASSQSVFEVVIGPVAADHLDIRRLRVEESLRGQWTELGPAEPASVNVRVPLPGTHVFAQPTLNFVPTSEWVRQVLPIAGPLPKDLDELTALLQVEAGTRLELRAVELAPLDGAGRAAVAQGKSRSELLFEQANLAAHSWVAAGLLALVLAPTGGAAALSLVLLLTAVVVTGSRTAFLAGALGGAALVLSRTKLRLAGGRLGLAAVLTGLVLVVVAAAVGGDALGRLAFWQDGAAGGAVNQVSRVEIWQAAVIGIGQEPFAGWGTDGFSRLWSELHPGDARAAPRHAHNFWLQAGVDYGLPGIFAALWLTVGLVVLARRSGRAALLVTLALLLMQIFDSTLTFVGVLLPLAAVLNDAGRRHRPILTNVALDSNK